MDHLHGDGSAPSLKNEIRRHCCVFTTRRRGGQKLPVGTLCRVKLTGVILMSDLETAALRTDGTAMLPVMQCRLWRPPRPPPQGVPSCPPPPVLQMWRVPCVPPGCAAPDGRRGSCGTAGTRTGTCTESGRQTAAANPVHLAKKYILHSKAYIDMSRLPLSAHCSPTLKIF